MPEDKTPLITVYARTDVGMVRAGNEDTFLVVNLNTADTWTPVTIEGDPPESLTSFHQGEHGSILAVSDGMGGALAGEVASRMAVEGVRERMLKFQSNRLSSFPFHERLRLAVEQANVHINNESVGNAEYAGMGATFTAAGVYDGSLVLAQIGDSRCYLVRSGRIHLLTHDQSLVWQLVEAGHITEEEAETHQYKNVILQALGAQPRVNVVVDRVKLSAGDHILLCSDGLSGRVRAEEMLQIITSSSSLRESCQRLIQLANERGGDDNITVIVARFDGDELPPPNGLETTRIERDPNLPYEVELEEDTDPEGTVPLGSIAAPAAAPRREAEPRPATAPRQVDPFSVTSVGMPAITHVPPPASAPTTGADPPPTPPPQAVRTAPQRPSRAPLLGLLLAGALLGAILFLVWAFQIRQSNASSSPAGNGAQPHPTPPPTPAPQPAPALVPEPAPLSADDLEDALERLEERALELDPERRRALEARVDALKVELKKAKEFDEGKQIERTMALESVARKVSEVEAEFFPAGHDPLGSEGR